MINDAAYEDAIGYFQSKIDSCAYTCPDTLTAYLYIYLGTSLKLSNQYDSALFNFKKGIDQFKRINHVDGQAFGLTWLAELYRSIYQRDKAITNLKIVDSLNTNHELSLATEAYFYSRYAAVLHGSSKSYDLEKVVEYSNKVIELSKKLKDKDLEAGSLNELGYFYESRNFKRSGDYYLKACDIYTETKNIRYAARVLLNLSRLHMKNDLYEKSLEYAEKGIEVSKGRNWLSVKPDLHNLKWQAHKMMNQPALALEAFGEYHGAFYEARKSEWNRSILEVEAKYDISEKERQLAEIQHAQTLSRIENEEKTHQLTTLLLIGLLLLIVIGVLYWTYKKTEKSNLLLNDSVKEKEILMQEVHHRVKNNLTFLKSLLYLRSKSSDDEQVKLVLDECQARIQSMALVHQNLYNVDDSSKVDFSLFLKELFIEVKELFDKDNVEVSIDTEQKMLEMRVSVFLGLILNELMTNSFKYAFDEQTIGKVAITFTESNDSYALDYTDSGSGPPVDFDIQKSKGFGFKLINILLNQLDAKMTYAGSINTFKIAMPK